MPTPLPDSVGLCELPRGQIAERIPSDLNVRAGRQCGRLDGDIPRNEHFEGVAARAEQEIEDRQLSQLLLLRVQRHDTFAVRTGTHVEHPAQLDDCFALGPGLVQLDSSRRMRAQNEPGVPARSDSVARRPIE